MAGHGYEGVDFAALLDLEAKAAGLELTPEDVPVSDGLGGDQPVPAGQSAS